VQPLDARQMRGQPVDDLPRKHGDSILAALAVTHSDLTRGQIDVLHPQLGAFQQSQAGPIHQGRHQPDAAVEARQDRPYLVPAEHHRQPHGPASADHLRERVQVSAEHRAVQK
jgi:hypothetical protein